MADDYTPTTTEVREYYMKSAEADDRRDEFNRWLAGRDAQKRAEWEAEQGEPEWEYGVYDPSSNEVDPCGTEPVTRESFTGIRWEETGEHIVKRRAPGPWLPVDENGESK